MKCTSQIGFIRGEQTDTIALPRLLRELRNMRAKRQAASHGPPSKLQSDPTMTHETQAALHTNTINPVSFQPVFDAGPGKYRIGIIILSNDYATERDFINMRPSEDITYFVARIPIASEITPESLAETEGELSRAASLLLPGGRIDTIAYSCTALRTVGYTEPVQGYGQLLRTH